MLNFKTLKEFVNRCEKSGVPDNTPIFIGDDEELNGIHEAYFIETLDTPDRIAEFSDLFYAEQPDPEFNILIS